MALRQRIRGKSAPTGRFVTNHSAGDAELRTNPETASACVLTKRHRANIWQMLGAMGRPGARRSSPVPVVTQPRSRLHRNQVEAKGQLRDGRAVRECAAIAQCEPRLVEASPLAMVDRLFRQSEVTPAPPSNLHDHERRRRTRVDGDQVKLCPADPYA
jgi:hypothetical protein